MKGIIYNICNKLTRCIIGKDVDDMFACLWFQLILPKTFVWPDHKMAITVVEDKM
jgi:hypothetical protein